MTKPINVGFFLSSVQDMGGAVRVAVSLANRMANDFNVTIIEHVAHQSVAFPLDERIKIVTIHSDARRFREQFTQLRKPLTRALKENNIDVLFGICVEESAIALMPCKSAGCKLVFCDHGALVNQLDDKTTTFLRNATSKFCNKLVVLTNQTKGDYHRLLHVPNSRMEVIPNWVSNELLKEAPTCDVTVKRALWAGRLDHEKGVDHLLEIAKRVMPSHPDWMWDVWGASVLDGEDGFDLAKELEVAGLSNQVVLRGRYSRTQDVFPNYALATLTSYREGLPVFLLEAMAYGLPMLSFDVDTGPRDLIMTGVSGYLVKPFDYDQYAQLMGKLMDDVDMRQSFSAAAKHAAQSFGEDAVYPQWKNLVERLGGKGGIR